jgi:hypothetical protein
VSPITDHPVALFIAATLLLWITAMILVRRSDKINQDRALLQNPRRTSAGFAIRNRPANATGRSFPSHLPTSHNDQYDDTPTN